MATKEAPLLEIKFCDNSSDSKTYDETRYGNIQARDAFSDLCALAKDNFEVWVLPPHVAEVTVSLRDADPVCERFACPCKQREAQRA